MPRDSGLIHHAPLWPAGLRHPLLFRLLDAVRDHWRDRIEQRRFARRRLPASAERVLLIRDRGLGDVLQVSTMFRGVRARYRARRLDLATSPEAAALLEADPGLDHVLPSSSPPPDLARAYDLYINLHVFDNSPAARALVRSMPRERLLGRSFAPGADEEWYAHLAGGCWLRKYCRIADIPFSPRLPLEIRIHPDAGWEQDRAALLARLPWLGEEGPARVGVCLGGKDWHRNYSVAFLGRLLPCLARRFRVFLFGLKSERGATERDELRKVLAANPGVHDLTDRLRLRELLMVLQAADALVTCDTGPVHLAIGLGTPLVALFGHTPGTQLLGPCRAGERHLVLTPRSGCRACGYRLRDACLRERRAQCMDRFEPGEVLAAVGRLLAGGRAEVGG